MKKILSLIAVFCFALSAMSETVFEFTSAADLNQTKDGFSIALEKGSGSTAPDYKSTYYNSEYHNDMRLYLGNTITVEGSGLTNIQMIFAKSNASNKEYAGLSASVETLVSGGVSESNTDWKIDVWSGSATKVVFTLTGKGQRQIKQLMINGDPVSIDPYLPAPLPTEEYLVADYSYSEPTIIHVKDTTVEKNEYAFIDNNLLVHCDLGSIIKAEEDSNPDDEEDDSHPAYFNCNAGYTLTFTATKAIKGIEIDGYVRKAFSASCDHGEMEYLSDEDFELEDWPVCVIRNINATSVTLDCPKQIRCYEVRVYFESNPEPLDGDQGIESPAQKAECRKWVQNGQLFIRRGEHTYDAQGKKLD